MADFGADNLEAFRGEARAWLEANYPAELRDPKTHRVLASTFADGKGFFAFDDKKYGKRIELRVAQKGFTATQYTAMLRPFGDEHIHLVLSPGA